MNNNDDLLTASLDTPQTKAPYSTGALIAAAFFGGGVAVATLALLNAERVQRLPKDLLWVALGFAVSVAAILLTMSYYNFGTDDGASSNVRMVSRGVGFLLAGGYYLLHKPQYRTMTVAGIDAPKPYFAVIACVIVSIGVNMGLASITLATSPVPASS